MGRQDGLVKLKGSVGEITFYKTEDGYLARKKTGVTSQRMREHPSPDSSKIKFQTRIVYETPASKISFAYFSRKADFKNFPTEVFGIAGTKE